MTENNTSRCIDDFGRVVLPKKIRDIMKLREGDAVDIDINDDGDVILKKVHSSITLETLASRYAELLWREAGNTVLITDRDTILATAGVGSSDKKELVNKYIGEAVERVIETQLIDTCNEVNPYRSQEHIVFFKREYPFESHVIVPIIIEREVVGTVIMATIHPNTQFAGPERVKLARLTADILAERLVERSV